MFTLKNKLQITFYKNVEQISMKDIFLLDQKSDMFL